MKQQGNAQHENQFCARDHRLGTARCSQDPRTCTRPFWDKMACSSPCCCASFCCCVVWFSCKAKQGGSRTWVYTSGWVPQMAQKKNGVGYFVSHAGLRPIAVESSGTGLLLFSFNSVGVVICWAGSKLSVTGPWLREAFALSTDDSNKRTRCVLGAMGRVDSTSFPTASPMMMFRI